MFTALQRTVHAQQRKVRRQRKHRRHPRQRAEVARRAQTRRHPNQPPPEHAPHQAAPGVGRGLRQMPPERGIKGLQRVVVVVLRRRLNLFQQPRVAAYRALAEHHHAARQNVGALDGDANRRRLVQPRDMVARAKANARTAVHIHRVVGDLAHAFGQVVFGNRRRDGRAVPLLQRLGDDAARGVGQPGVAGDARQRLGDALKLADGQMKLVADARVGAGGEAGGLAGRGRQRRQRDGAPVGEAFHQHAPAVAGAVGAADDPVKRNEHIAPARRPVHEGDIQRQVAPADLDAGRVHRNQRQRDADIALVAEQVLRVAEPKRQPQQRRHRRQRDVALVPVQAHAEHFAPVEMPAADDAGVGDVARVRPGLRAGQREARNVVAARQPRQVMAPLFGRAVFQYQFAGAERIRHHRRHRRRHRTPGDFHDDARMGEGRETEAAVLLRNNDAEEFLLAQVIPHRRRQAAFRCNPPVVKHRAQRVDGAFEKGALLRRQLRRFLLHQLRPVGRAGEQLALP